MQPPGCLSRLAIGAPCALALLLAGCFVSLDESLWRVAADAGNAADAENEAAPASDQRPSDAPPPIDSSPSDRAKPAVDTLSADTAMPADAEQADASPPDGGPPPDAAPPDHGPADAGMCGSSRCSDLEVCIDGSCVLACTDECQAGDSRCADADSLQSCDQAPSGCTVWSTPVACGANETCSGGQCAPACTAAGLAASCDPIENDGCQAGDCYLTPAGTLCVCPPGTVPTGGSCNSTVECAPGNVCAGSEPPGKCRLLCDPTSPKCPPGMQCLTITGHPSYGFCRP